MILVYHFILSTNEIFVVSYGTGYQSTYLATNNSKVRFFLPTVYKREEGDSKKAGTLSPSARKRDLATYLPSFPAGPKVCLIKS